jgi:tetratricopeptide (TPR) repeat protein
MLRLHRLSAMLLLGVWVVGGSCGSLAQVQERFRRGMQAQQSYQVALERYEARDYEAAIPLLRRAVELEPTLDDAEAHLAWSYYHIGEYVQATRHFRQVLTRQPRWEGLHNGLGWSRYRVGRHHLALESFRQALALDPRYRDAGVGFAYSLFDLGRYAEALPHLERLTSEGEGGAFSKPTADVEEVRGRLAWTLFYLGDFARARDQFRKGVAARPDWPGLHNGLGWSLLRLGNRQAARASFTRALQLLPDYPDAGEGLALAR